ncbi:MAG: HAMP domain-containing histidine kinase, partial [Actinobacteria bacterium]|nr:HAMP domain-containing histidine kinase [Actinomycetota bacterium]
LVKEYSDSVGDEDITTEDHLEIAREMDEWLGKMKGQMSYMSDIISTVKDQAAQFNTGSSFYFTVDEMLKRTKILMQHSLIKANCHLEVEVKTGIGQMIFGDINSLVQIMDNIIANAIQAYEGKGGRIHFSVERIEEDILISVTDFAGGIKPEVQKVLFNEMITTKGKHGTGLGLYMSHSTINGVFRGNMWFESTPQVGTTFYIRIPWDNRE